MKENEGERGQVKVRIKRCQRCRDDHDALVFRALSHPKDEYKWWAICPATKEPILLAPEQIVEKSREKEGE